MKGKWCLYNILGSYARLINEVVENYSDCFDYVDYIGQRGRYPLAPNSLGHVDVICSKKVEDVIPGEIYNIMFKNFINENNTIRNWYKDTCILEIVCLIIFYGQRYWGYY